MLNRNIDITVARILGCNPQRQRWGRGSDECVVCSCRLATHADKDMLYWTGLPSLRDWSNNWTHGGKLLGLMSYYKGEVELHFNGRLWFCRNKYERVGVQHVHRDHGDTMLHAVCNAFIDWSHVDSEGFKEAMQNSRGWFA